MRERVKSKGKTSEIKSEKLASNSRETDFSQSYHSSLESALFLQGIVGNQGVQRLFKDGVVQAKLKIGQPGEKYEREADRVADMVLRIPDPQAHNEPTITPLTQVPHIQWQCPACENEMIRQEMEDEEVLQRKETNNSLSQVPSNFETKMSTQGIGKPLPESVQNYFEPRFGYDFSQVRVHNDVNAAESAKAISARAYTFGKNIFFGIGEFAPETPKGMRLLAHELSHTIQQSISNSNKHTILRQEEEEPETQPSIAPNLPPPLSLPETGLILLPGLRPSLVGQGIPVPANLRITNALGIGPDPTFVLDISPRLLVANILENVDLFTRTIPGTPPGTEIAPENQARISLVNPRITLNPVSGRLQGSAILSIGSDFPPILVPPTEIDATIETSQLGRFNGRLGLGQLEANFSLRLHYDTESLEQSLSPVFSPEGSFTRLLERFQRLLQNMVPNFRFEGLSDIMQGVLRSLIAGDIEVAEFVNQTIELIRGSIPADANLESIQTTVTQFANEIRHPGFSLSGGLGLDIPFLGTLPLTGVRAEAATTVPLERPLLGAPTAFPFSLTATGVIVAPPGSLSETSVPAIGFTRSSFGERSGSSSTVALLPTFSPSAISAGEPIINQFPFFAFAEISSIRRVSNDLDIGLRLTLQISTPELRDLLFGADEGRSSAEEQSTRILQELQNARQEQITPNFVTPNLGVTLFGRFNAF
jgi:hypothetical protein